jgi:hypothetical protein
MTDRIVHTWQKNGREEVRASLETFKGHRLAHVRVYVQDEVNGPKPTNKGIAVRLEQLPKLKESVDSLIAAVEAEAA